jgi:phage N-6-adenine-methyltransferase
MSTLSLVTQTDRSRSIAQYNPVKGLAKIAKAETGEKHWRRAKDPQKLFGAIAEKIQAQADYVIWRDAAMAVVVAERGGGGPGRRKKGVPASRPVLPKGDPGKKIIHKWRKRLCMKNGKGTEIDPKKIKAALEEAGHRCTRICEQQPAPNYLTCGTDEWHTPPKYVELARRALGKIDLDPASSKEPQRVVKATCFFTKRDDALKHQWRGRVFLNPPYSAKQEFIDKLLSEVASERVTHAILLVHNNCFADWWQRTAREASALFFPAGKLKFRKPDRTVGTAPALGQVFLYFGNNVQRFAATFADAGFVVVPYTN